MLGTQPRTRLELATPSHQRHSRFCMSCAPSFGGGSPVRRRREGIDDLAIRDHAPTTATRADSAQLFEKALEILQFFRYRPPMLGSHPLDLGAGHRLVRRQLQQVPHLVQGEPEIAAATNEVQPLPGVHVIPAVITRSTSGAQHQPNLLVIPNRHDSHAGFPRQIANAKRFCSSHSC